MAGARKFPVDIDVTKEKLVAYPSLIQVSPRGKICERNGWWPLRKGWAPSMGSLGLRKNITIPKQVNWNSLSVHGDLSMIDLDSVKSKIYIVS